MENKNRFTHSSSTTRGNISKRDRQMVYRRDNFTCQYCKNPFPPLELTIDHLVPLANKGLNEITNFITCCQTCNQKKADKPLTEFAKQINISIKNIPVYGDPIIDNEDLPIQIRLLRKKIFDSYRINNVHFTGKSAQKKLEKKFRMAFWDTPKGVQLEKLFPSLPGAVRIMIPEILTIVNSEDDYLLLIELAKSASTRNLINSRMKEVPNILKYVESVAVKSNNEPLRKRINDAIKRFNSALKKSS